MAAASVKRGFFVWAFAAAAVLPVWVLVGYALQGSTVTGLLGVLLLAPVVLLVELGLALLFSARTAVRRARALDGPAIGVLAAFQAGVIGFGFFGPATAWFGVLAFAAAVAGFWLGGRLLLADVRSRVRETMAGFGAPVPEQPRRTIDAGDYVVIKPSSR
jgi:hypothetical protein